MEMAFSRPLREMVPRLELLGFTLDALKREYSNRVEVWREERLSMADDDEKPLSLEPMGFDEFCAFAAAYKLKDLDDTFVSSLGNTGRTQVRGRFNEPKITDRIPVSWDHDEGVYSERDYFGRLIGVLHPYSVLRLLAQDSANSELDVEWQYGPLVDAGWASANEFQPAARRTQTFLIATEGSSDAHILNHALGLLRPGIADFFRFIDVTDGHPFSGTGNLVKFAEGLAKIDVHNQVVFVFDNDAEGYSAYQKVLRLSLPSNMRTMVLPELEQFKAFPAHGPDGMTNSNINRRAAAIECYLDLNLANYPPAKVVWTNYKKELDAYQGALEYKESYAKEFLGKTATDISTGAYDVGKLQIVLDALFAECSSLAGSWQMP